MNRYEIATRKLLSMQECIDNGDKGGFLKEMKSGYTLSNCACGDTFLQEKIQKVLSNALGRFLN